MTPDPEVSANPSPEVKPNLMQNPLPTPLMHEMPKKQRPSAFVFIIMIPILIASGAFGVLAYQKYFPVKPIATPSPTPTATPDPTANWKTYSLPHSLFKYPANYFVDTKVSGNSDVTIYTSNNQLDPNRFYISVAEYKGSEMDLVTLGAITNDQLTSITVDGKQIYKISGTATPGEVSENLYAIDGPSYYAEISFSDYPNRSGYVEFKQNVDKILSTFKFTN